MGERKEGERRRVSGEGVMERRGRVLKGKYEGEENCKEQGVP